LFQFNEPLFSAKTSARVLSPSTPFGPGLLIPSNLVGNQLADVVEDQVVVNRAEDLNAGEWVGEDQVPTKLVLPDELVVNWAGAFGAFGSLGTACWSTDGGWMTHTLSIGKNQEQNQRNFIF